MKKNDVSKINPIRNTHSKYPNETTSDDEENTPTTEEANDDSEEAETTYYLDLLYTETLVKIFTHKCNSVDELISTLKSHHDFRLNKLITHLNSKKITGSVSLKALKNLLMGFILKLMAPIKMKDEIDIDIDTLHLKQCDLLRFYLKIFNFTPNSIIEEKSNDKFGYNIIMLACENCKNHYLLNLLVEDLKGDINETSRDGTRRTPLHISCGVGNLNAVKILARSGAEINIGRCTALGIALSEKHHSIVQFLLSLPTLDVTLLNDGVSPYLLAAQCATAQNFLKIMTNNSIDPNIITLNNESALSLALLRGSKVVPDDNRDTIVRILLNSSCFTVDCSLVSNGETTLFMASRVGNLFALNKLLGKGANYNFIASRGPYKGHSVLSIAVYEGCLDIVERLIDLCELDFIKPIVAANLNNQYRLLNLAFQSQKSRNENKKNHELIYQLLQKRWTESHPEQVRTYINSLIKDENLNELRLWKKFILSNHSVMPETGNTPLHTASANGKTKVINFLVLELEVPVHSQNIKGDTPLHVASRKKQSKTISQLLRLGSSSDEINHDKENPFSIARSLHNEGCIRAFVDYSFCMGQELPSSESARADNDELLAKIIDEFLPPALEKPSEKALNKDLPPKPKKKTKKRKNRNKPAIQEAPYENGDVQILNNIEHSAANEDAITESKFVVPDENTPPLPRLSSPAIDHPEINFTEGSIIPMPPPELSPETLHQYLDTQNSDISDEENSSFTDQALSQDISRRETQSSSQHHQYDSSEEDGEDESQEETANESTEDQSEENITDSSPKDASEEESIYSTADDQLVEKKQTKAGCVVVAILPSPPPSPVRYRSFFSHTIWSDSNQNIRCNPSLQPNCDDFSETILSELKDAIENEFCYILSDPAHVFVKAALQNLIDYFSRLNYFAIIGRISEDSLVLGFIKELRDHTLQYGLDINRNVNDWQIKAIKVYKTMLDRWDVFHLDYVEEGVGSNLSNP